MQQCTRDFSCRTSHWEGSCAKPFKHSAACFTHPEISFVGYTEPQARDKAQKEGFEISIAKTSFKANTKALAENEGEGLAKLIYIPDNGEILGVHIFGMHAADLIHEASNAIPLGTQIQDIKYAVHVHPTLSEVLDELFKSAHGVQGAKTFPIEKKATPRGKETLPTSSANFRRKKIMCQFLPVLSFFLDSYHLAMTHNIYQICQCFLPNSHCFFRF